MLTLPEQLGQILIVGINGGVWDKPTEEFLGRIRPGGVIFFQRNIATAPQFRQLVERVRGFLSPPPFLALDLEGGLVDRLRDVLAPLPSVSDAARAEMGQDLGRIAGRELAAFSLNVDFAPVLDLGAAESRIVLGSRTAGASPAEVVRFAQGFLKGLGESGILGCGKHFPGLGSGQCDSHKELPLVEKDAEQMWQQDLEPFRALARVLPMIMVAHVCCPSLERAFGGESANVKERLPASLSPAIVSGLLKGKMEYSGLVLCDDLEMGGVLEGCSREEAAIAALQAGCDVLLLCGPEANTETVFDSLLERANSDSGFGRLVEQAAEKVLFAKRSLGITSPPRTALEAPDFESLCLQITELGMAVRTKLAIAPVPARPDTRQEGAGR